MSRLHLHTTFLRPVYHGKGQGNASIEWPIPPWRIFCAAVSACKRHGLNDAPLRALESARWSAIHVPIKIGESDWTTFVPSTFDDLDGKCKRPINERLAFLSGANVTYDIDGYAGDTTALADIVRRISHVGLSVDRCMCRVGEAINEPNRETWRLSCTGGKQLRVPRAGSVDDLERAHEAIPASMYRSGGFLVADRKPDAAVPGSANYSREGGHRYAVFKLLRADDHRQAVNVSALRACHVAAWMRHLSGQVFSGEPWVKTVVMGHADDGHSARSGDRWSFLPLPSIHYHDGHAGSIRRVLIAELDDQPQSRMAMARSMLSCHTVEPGTILGEMDDDWVVERYVKSSRVWASVTPVVMPGYGDTTARLERIARRALLHSGVEADDVRVQSGPYMIGSERANRYVLPKHLHHLPCLHMRVKFSHPVSGPIALGRGRHCGLGVMVGIEREG